MAPNILEGQCASPEPRIGVSQPTFQYGPHICLYRAYGLGFLTVLSPGTARGPSVLAHMGLGGLLVGLERAANGAI